mmetsp:Transcript_21323/g.53707  ORF Transcript_21323/g.53707 Transcript_21323/m.53707 type:complete len:216 (-) Transcript_21323:1147-1794(-)
MEPPPFALCNCRREDEFESARRPPSCTTILSTTQSPALAPSGCTKPAHKSRFSPSFCMERTARASEREAKDPGAKRVDTRKVVVTGFGVSRRPRSVVVDALLVCWPAVSTWACAEEALATPLVPAGANCAACPRLLVLETVAAAAALATAPVPAAAGAWAAAATAGAGAEGAAPSDAVDGAATRAAVEAFADDPSHISEYAGRSFRLTSLLAMLQ